MEAFNTFALISNSLIAIKHTHKALSDLHNPTSLLIIIRIGLRLVPTYQDRRINIKSIIGLIGALDECKEVKRLIFGAFACNNLHISRFNEENPHFHSAKSFVEKKLNLGIQSVGLIFLFHNAEV